MEFLIPLFAILNRARGSQLFGFTTSTTVGRLVSMFGMALLTGFATQDGNWLKFDCITLFSFSALMFWCVWSWDYLWAAEIGQSGAASGFPPVDGIMYFIWGTPPVAITNQMNMPSRIWGLIAMGLRMSLAAGYFAGLAYLTGHNEHAWIAALTPLLSVPYFAWGLFFYYFPKNASSVIEMSELTVGAMLGALTILMLS